MTTQAQIEGAPLRLIGSCPSCSVRGRGSRRGSSAGGRASVRRICRCTALVWMRCGLNGALDVIQKRQVCCGGW